MIVLVVGDLRWHYPSARVTHDDVEHAQARRDRLDVAEGYGDHGRGPRAVELVAHGDGYTRRGGGRTQKQRHENGAGLSAHGHYGITNAGSATAQKAALGSPAV